MRNPDTYYNYDTILERMLDRVPDSFDKREGSMIFDALAPAAMELSFVYLEIAALYREAFPDSASREYLVRHAGETGLEPFPATHAVVRVGVQPKTLDLPEGTRFSHELLNFAITEKAGLGEYLARCETPGSDANASLGDLTPIEYITGLERAEIVETVIPGEDDEDTEHFRTRYFESIRSKAFGGNVFQYEQEVRAMAGVGGVKVTPVWHGGGTVKVTFTDADHGVPSSELVARVQEAVDPPRAPGHGLGTAPIGHTVTVEPAAGAPIDISFVVTYQPGWDWQTLEPYAAAAIDDYFKGLASTWEDEDGLVVRISQIEMRLLDLEGVLDIEGTTLGGLQSNLQLDDMEIPVRGALSATTKQ